MEVVVGVLVSYCCVTNHKALICKYLFSLMVSVGQVFGNSQRGWYGLGFLGVKMQPEGFIADGGSTSTAAMQCWRWREAPAPLHRLCECPGGMVAGFPGVSGPREGEPGGGCPSQALPLEAAQHSFHHILPVMRDT